MFRSKWFKASILSSTTLVLSLGSVTPAVGMVLNGGAAANEADERVIARKGTKDYKTSDMTVAQLKKLMRDHGENPDLYNERRELMDRVERILARHDAVRAASLEAELL